MIEGRYHVRKRRSGLLRFVAAAAIWLTASTGLDAREQAQIKINFLDTKSPPQYTFIFSYLEWDGTPIRVIDLEDLSVLVDKQEIELEDPELTTFKDQEYPAAILILFPDSKRYAEEDYNLRHALGGFIKKARSIFRMASTWRSTLQTRLPTSSRTVCGPSSTISTCSGLQATTSKTAPSTISPSVSNAVFNT